MGVTETTTTSVPGPLVVDVTYQAIYTFSPELPDHDWLAESARQGDTARLEIWWDPAENGPTLDFRDWGLVIRWESAGYYELLGDFNLYHLARHAAVMVADYLRQHYPGIAVECAAPELPARGPRPAATQVIGAVFK